MMRRLLILNKQEQMQSSPSNFPNPDGTAGSGEGSKQAVPAPQASLSRRPNGFELWARDLIVSVAASVFIITFLYQPVRVEGTSMLPRLEDQDRLFINKFAYHFSSIERGDVVVFHYPLDPEKSYIKRVIAVPGDRLEIDRGTVWVNGKRQIEPYVPAEYRDARSYAETVVPEGAYIMMGDHRSPWSVRSSMGKLCLSTGPRVTRVWCVSNSGFRPCYPPARSHQSC